MVELTHSTLMKLLGSIFYHEHKEPPPHVLCSGGGRGNFKKLEPRGCGTVYNSGYMVPLRSTQIFAPLRSAKTSYPPNVTGK